MHPQNIDYINLAKKITNEFKSCEQVVAIAIGGSVASESIDEISDIDLYVYSDGMVPLDLRRLICARTGGIHENLNLSFWDQSDEWVDGQTGILVDLIYWHQDWIENNINRVLGMHEANVGYTTCFWHTVRNSMCLFDRTDWFTRLKQKSEQGYPKNLKKAIIDKNYPILKSIHSSYYNQIKKAVTRSDIISINHRIAALLASYFDILFAVNNLTNPGEKRVLQHALATCEYKPINMEIYLKDILSYKTGMKDKLLTDIEKLVTSLDELLQDLGIITLKSE